MIESEKDDKDALELMAECEKGYTERRILNRLTSEPSWLTHKDISKRSKGEKVKP